MTRKEFFKHSVVLATGLTLAPNIIGSPTDRQFKGADSSVGEKLLLKNVRLETGFEYEGAEVVATRTDLFCLEISDGKITQILPNNPAAQAIDAQGYLMLPAFKDMHIHLDKTFYGGPWQAARKRQGGVKGMIALEQEILPELLKTSTDRAERLIELLQSCGTSFARSQVNIEPTSQLKSLTNLQKALDNKKAGFAAELVAFPQHGIYYTDSAALMKEAAQMGVDYIGGVDPYSLDGAIEKTMDFTIQLALDYNKGLDIHLHETGPSAVKTVEYLLNKVEENPVLKGKTYLSHCFVLGRLEAKEQEAMAEKLGAAQVGVISTIPFGSLIMPIPTLYKHGVKVGTGNDSIIDHWNTWGSGSVLEKAKLMAQLYGYGTEFGLSRCLKLATFGLTPLDDKGTQQWPRSGDEASVVFLDASCSAEAVSRLSPVKSLIHQGNIVF